MSEIRSRIRKRAAAALGVTALAAITTASAYDHLADTGMEQINHVAVQAQDLGTDQIDHGQIDWKAHPENPALVAATTTIEGKNGPVRFHFNQSDEISSQTFDPSFIPLVDKGIVNEFSDDSIRTLSSALNEMASTQSGQDMLSKIAEEFSGDVQVSRLPASTGAAGMGRTMTKGTHSGYIMHRDETHDITRIAIDQGVIDHEFRIGNGLNRDGYRKGGDLGALLMHELAHATYFDERALHRDDEHGYKPVYTENGEVRDIAKHVENVYNRERAGQDLNAPATTDDLLYQSNPLQTNGDHWIADSEFEKARRRAHIERYTHTQEPGMDFDQMSSAVASSLGGLKLTDEEYDKHAGELALDAMVYTGAPIMFLDDAPRPSLEEAAQWLEEKGGADQSNQIIRRYTHEIESAQRISQYRDTMKTASIEGVTALDQRIDQAARQNPEKAIELFEKAVDPRSENRSAAAARDVLDVDGVYAKTKSFMATHEKGRKEYALNETLVDIDGSGIPGRGMAKVAVRKFAKHSSFFEQGQDMRKTRYDALTTKMDLDQSYLLAQAQPEQAKAPAHRLANAER